MTIPQLMAALDAHDRIALQQAILQSEAVFAGCAPAFCGESGARAASEWTRRLKRQIEG